MFISVGLFIGSPDKPCDLNLNAWYTQLPPGYRPHNNNNVND